MGSNRFLPLRIGHIDARLQRKKRLEDAAAV